jgi:hypothetical protein
MANGGRNETCGSMNGETRMEKETEARGGEIVGLPGSGRAAAGASKAGFQVTSCSGEEGAANGKKKRWRWRWRWRRKEEENQFSLSSLFFSLLLSLFFSLLLSLLLSLFSLLSSLFSQFEIISKSFEFSKSSFFSLSLSLFSVFVITFLPLPLHKQKKGRTKEGKKEGFRNYVSAPPSAEERKEGRKKERKEERKEGRKEERKEGRKEGTKKERKEG